MPFSRSTNGGYADADPLHFGRDNGFNEARHLLQHHVFGTFCVGGFGLHLKDLSFLYGGDADVGAAQVNSNEHIVQV